MASRSLGGGGGSRFEDDDDEDEDAEDMEDCMVTADVDDEDIVADVGWVGG